MRSTARDETYIIMQGEALGRARRHNEQQGAAGCSHDSKLFSIEGLSPSKSTENCSLEMYSVAIAAASSMFCTETLILQWETCHTNVTLSDSNLTDLPAE